MVGHLSTNCYLVASDRTKEAIIIDPGDNEQKIIKGIEENKLKPVMIVNTHAHPDHIGANNEIAKKFNIIAALGEKDFDLISGWKNIFEEFSELKIEDLCIKKLLKEGDTIEVGELKFKVIETPGHSNGSICLFGEGVLFSGDTLFAGDSGRVDIFGGSEETMNDSLARLMELPERTEVYPGHGRSTTIGEEKIIYAKH